MTVNVLYVEQCQTTRMYRNFAECLNYSRDFFVSQLNIIVNIFLFITH